MFKEAHQFNIYIKNNQFVLKLGIKISLIWVDNEDYFSNLLD